MPMPLLLSPTQFAGRLIPMPDISYVLKSQRGTPMFAFDNETRARQEMNERKRKHGVNLRLFEVRMMERELAPERAAMKEKG